MERALESINNRMSRKYSNMFLLTNNKSEFTTYFKNPIKLNPDLDYEVALIYFSTFNTLFNIQSSLNNNQFIYSSDNGATWKTITFSDGGYDIDGFNAELKRLLVTNGDTTLSNGQTIYPIDISLNLSTTKTIVTLATNFKVNFTTGTVGYILGFDNKIISTGINNSDAIARLTSITAILIEVDIISGFYVNGVERNIIYSFPAYMVPVGYKINIFPNTPIYLPVNTQTITKIYIRITDESSNLLSLNGEETAVCMHIRQV